MSKSRTLSRMPQARRMARAGRRGGEDAEHIGLADDPGQ
jgi:hypothetical protein